MGEKRKSCRILVREPEGKRSLGRPERRWANSVKMDLTRIGWGGMNWITQAQDRNQYRVVMNIVLNLWVP
jgi:hypothetical protein